MKWQIAPRLTIIAIAMAMAAISMAGCAVIDGLSGEEEEEEEEEETEDCKADAECDDGYCVEGECVECDVDQHCSSGYCSQGQCVECLETFHCVGDQFCEDYQCLSGCEDIDCGQGECVDDDGDIHCECDEEAFLDGGVCVGCDCEIENGVGECDDEGVCEILSCDEGYSTDDDDPETGCECAPTDEPDPVDFIDANCDGFDGEFSRAVFVASGGDDDRNGSPARPVETIQRGIELALDDDERDQVFVSEGDYHETLRIEESVDIYGGYRDLGTGEWIRNEDTDETIISGEDVEGGHRPVKITEIDGAMELQMLTIIADDAPEQEEGMAGSSVGVTLYDTRGTFGDGDVSITHSRIEAGKGADGLDGEQGQDGEEGQDGDDADGDIASGGEIECDDGSQSQGGDGGMGAPQEENSSEENDGEDGQDSPDIGGGAGGSGGEATCSGEDEEAQDGEDGQDAPPLSSDADGDDASGEVEETMSFEPYLHGSSLILYRGHSGMWGEPGELGPGGGGGGGGGGWRGDNNCTGTYVAGGGGGGGGSGGCGGQGGEGGHWGGASVAVMAMDASLSIEYSELETHGGGAGGDGGPGGEGGEGGQGGEGGDLGSNPAQGGDGGAGADGGTGGGGSGGEGGPSVGLLVEDAEVDTQDVEFDIGESGSGGQGYGQAFDGPHGLHGDVVDFDD